MSATRELGDIKSLDEKVETALAREDSVKSTENETAS
jgi:hypothetical protein